MTTKSTARRIPVERHRRRDSARAFLREDGTRRRNADEAPESLPEMMGETFLASVTGGGYNALDDELERLEPEEVGGPFVPTSMRTELGLSVDATNPPDADVEALPLPNAGAPESARQPGSESVR